MIAIGGFQKNGVPANTVVVSLVEKQLFTNFAEFGNVPFCIAKFALVSLTDNRALTFGGVDCSSKTPFSSSYVIDTEEGFDPNRELNLDAVKKNTQERKVVNLDNVIVRSKTTMVISTPAPNDDDENNDQLKNPMPRSVDPADLKKKDSARNSINNNDDLITELKKRQQSFERKRLKGSEEANSTPDLIRLDSKSSLNIKTPTPPPLPQKRKKTLGSNYDDVDIKQLKKKHLSSSHDNRRRANTLDGSPITIDDHNSNSEYNNNEDDTSEENKQENEESEQEKVIESEDDEKAEKIVETDDEVKKEKIVETEETKQQEDQEDQESQKDQDNQEDQENQKEPDEQKEPEEQKDDSKESTESKIESSKKRHPTYIPMPNAAPLVTASSNIDTKPSQVNRSVTAQRAQSTIFKSPVDVNKSTFEPEPDLKLSSTFNENEFCRKFGIDASQLNSLHYQQMVMKMRNAYKLILENEGYENQIKSLNQKGSLVLKVSDESKRTHILFFSADDTYDVILQKANQVLGKDLAANKFSIQLPSEPATEFTQQSFEEKKEKLINEKLSYLKMSEN